MRTTYSALDKLDSFSRNDQIRVKCCTIDCGSNQGRRIEIAGIWIGDHAVVDTIKAITGVQCSVGNGIKFASRRIHAHLVHEEERPQVLHDKLVPVDGRGTGGDTIVSIRVPLRELITLTASLRTSGKVRVLGSRLVKAGRETLGNDGSIIERDGGEILEEIEIDVALAQQGPVGRVDL